MSLSHYKVTSKPICSKAKSKFVIPANIFKKLKTKRNFEMQGEFWHKRDFLV